ncbi:MAG TPA: response regulator [Verrucomicrobiae bacterium]|nr:response regulator [Verrucomicrobiae bacterium]
MNTLLEMQMPVLESMPSLKVLKPVKKKILLVDDDAAVRQILMRLLQEEGYFVLTAANGVEALALADATHFDLVMLDLNMPAKGGWSTFEELTAKSPTLPVIIITARPNQFFPALDSGVGTVLEKPLDFVKLFDTVHSLLEEGEMDGVKGEAA